MRQERVTVVWDLENRIVQSSLLAEMRVIPKSLGLGRMAKRVEFIRYQVIHCQER